MITEDVKSFMRDHIAKTSFVLAWSYEWEEAGKEFENEVDMMDQAPRTPESAYKFADELIAEFEKENSKSLVEKFIEAAKADGLDIETLDEFTPDPFRSQYTYAEEFGHCIAMMAVGSGVSWFDDHGTEYVETGDPEWPRRLNHIFEMKVPYKEYYLDIDVTDIEHLSAEQFSLKLLEWHAGQNTYLYSLASRMLAYGDKFVPELEVVEGAISELESNLRSGLIKKKEDRKDLVDLVKSLKQRYHAE